MEPVFFRSGAQFRAWLEENHHHASELPLGFFRKAANRDGVSYREALDEALCFGWIDGVRRKHDAVSYTIRFTPRRPHSVWSLVNKRRVEELQKLGRLAPAGLVAFAKREESRTGVYSFEQKENALETGHFDGLRKNRRAWAYFRKQAPSYQRQAAWWVASAKRDDTRARRLRTLIEHSIRHERLPQLTR